MAFSSSRNASLFTHTTREMTTYQRYYKPFASSSLPRPFRSALHTPAHRLIDRSIPFSSSLSSSSLLSSTPSTSSLSSASLPLSSRGLSGSALSKSTNASTRPVNTTKRFSSTASVESQGCATPPSTPRPTSTLSNESNHAWHIPHPRPDGVTHGASLQSHQSPHFQSSLLQTRDPLPLPLALKIFRPSTGTASVTTTTNTTTTVQASVSRLASNHTFQPPPAVLGSQPLFYLATRFPILAEQELKAIPNKTALDYSSFLIGAMYTSYPSPTTLRAVMRQFRNFLRDSARPIEAGGSVMEMPRARIWAQVIRGLIWMKEYRRARILIHMTQRMGIRPTGYTWRAICRGWIEQGDLGRAEALAAKVFSNPALSHEYSTEERPYYFTDMPLGATAFDLSPPGASSRPARPPSTRDGSRSSGKDTLQPFSGSRSSGSSSSTSSARHLHRSPMAPNSAPLFLVIEALVERGEMERARHWFDQVPESELTDLLTSDMVAGYLRVGQKSKAQEVIRIMARAGVKPAAIVFNPIVEHAVHTLGMEAAEGLVKDMVKLRIYLNLFTYKLLVKGYLASGQRDKALECIDRMRVSGIEPDRALGRMMLDGFLRDSEEEEEESFSHLGLDLGATLTKKGDYGPPLIMDPDRIQTEPRAKAMQPEDFLNQSGWSDQCLEWIRRRDLERVEELLQLALDNASAPSSPPTELHTEVVHVIRGLAKEGLMDRARYWFEHLARSEARMTDRTAAMTNETMVGLVNDLIAGYVQCSKPDEAQRIISLASEQGIQTTVETIHSFLDWSTTEEHGMEGAEQMVSRMSQAGVQPDSQTYRILCLGYAARGEIDGLKQSLARMESTAGFGGKDVDSSLLEVCREMLGGENPLKSDHDSMTSTTTTTATTGVFERLCARWVERDQMDQAEQLVERMIENSNVARSKIPYNTLIQGWIEQSQKNPPVSPTAIHAAETPGVSNIRATGVGSDLASESVPSSKSLRREMEQRKESVARMRKARSWFDRVPRELMTPDLVNEMIHGYLALDLESESEQLIGWMANEKIKPNVETYNHIMRHTVLRVSMASAEALLKKMESRGSIEENNEVERLRPDVETWNLLIRGYVMRGELRKALACLDRMMGRAEEPPKRTSTKASQSKPTSTMRARSTEKTDVNLGAESVNDAAEAEKIQEESEKVERVRVPGGARVGVRPSRGKATTTVVRPNEQTVEILLAGFGAETRMPQGEGDHERALDLYRSRVERQERQRVQLLEGLRAVGRGEGDDDGSEELDAAQLLGRWEVWQQQQQQARGPLADLLMTDLDWRAELQWEETLEIERSRERELSGKSYRW